MRPLEKKVVLITGASRGIGRATARKLAENGAHIAMGATGGDGLEKLENDLKQRGAEVLSARCDVSILSDCKNLVQKTLDRFGRIDVLVNNAGIGFSGKIVNSEPEQIEQMVRVNFLGVYYMTRMVLPSMVTRQAGDIVNLGSIAAIKYSPEFAVYSATKFAVRAFSEALRNEVQGDNVRVTLVHPGVTETSFFDTFASEGSPIPLKTGEIMKPEDIAAGILFALTRPPGVALNELTLRPAWQER